MIEAKKLMVSYVTVTSYLRLGQALVLHESIMRHSPAAKFLFFCIDTEAADALRRLDLARTEIVEVEQFVSDDVLARRETLRVIEFCALCKSLALIYALNAADAPDWAAWVDSDMFAFGNPDEAFADCRDANVLLTPHRFFLPEFTRFEASVGRYNAGYVAFRNTGAGREALNWWRDRCLEACPIVPTADLFGDQKYLNSIPGMFDGVAEAAAGVNCAPWNVFGLDVEDAASGVRVSGAPLLLYHFQGLRPIRHWLIDLYGSKLALRNDVRSLIYRPYARALTSQLRAMRKISGDPDFGIDAEFRGLRNLLRIAEQFIRSRNIVLLQPGAFAQ